MTPMSSCTLRTGSCACGDISTIVRQEVNHSQNTVTRRNGPVRPYRGLNVDLFDSGLDPGRGRRLRRSSRREEPGGLCRRIKYGGRTRVDAKDVFISRVRNPHHRRHGAPTVRETSSTPDDRRGVRPATEPGGSEPSVSTFGREDKVLVYPLHPHTGLSRRSPGSGVTRPPETLRRHSVRPGRTHLRPSPRPRPPWSSTRAGMDGGKEIPSVSGTA